MEKPRLVRVIPEKLDGDYADEGLAMLEGHGYLWFLCEEQSEDDKFSDMPRYRSLATKEEYWWFDEEVEDA